MNNSTQQNARTASTTLHAGGNKSAVKKAFLAASVLALTFASLSAPASAAIPGHLPMAASAQNKPLGEYDPYGRLASPGCDWTRIEVPSAGGGLVWVPKESCDFSKS